MNAALHQRLFAQRRRVEAALAQSVGKEDHRLVCQVQPAGKEVIQPSGALYHGTNRFNLPSITNVGLIPQIGGNTKDAQSIDKEAEVHLTTDLEVARKYGDAVLKIDISHPEIKSSFKKDPHEKSSVTTNVRIPPDAISVIEGKLKFDPLTARILRTKDDFGSSGQRGSDEFTVLWYVHPRMGLRVRDHAGSEAPITHAEWMDQEGVKKHHFDSLPRGRVHVYRRLNMAKEFLHTGHDTPPDVLKHISRKYNLKGMERKVLRQKRDWNWDRTYAGQFESRSLVDSENHLWVSDRWNDIHSTDRHGAHTHWASAEPHMARTLETDYKGRASIDHKKKEMNLFVPFEWQHDSLNREIVGNVVKHFHYNHGTHGYKVTVGHNRTPFTESVRDKVNRILEDRAQSLLKHRKDVKQKQFTITADDDTLKSLDKFFALLHHNPGHSATFGMDFDGDGHQVFHVDPAPSKGYAGRDRKGEVCVAENIDRELEFFKKELPAHSHLFKAAHIVGSWARQQSDRLPDRRGEGTSDIDLMIEPHNRYDMRDHWQVASDLENKYYKNFKRPIHLNLEPVLGNAPHKTFWMAESGDLRGFKGWMSPNGTPHIFNLWGEHAENHHPDYKGSDKSVHAAQKAGFVRFGNIRGVSNEYWIHYDGKHPKSGRAALATLKYLKPEDGDRVDVSDIPGFATSVDTTFYAAGPAARHISSRGQASESVDENRRSAITHHSLITHHGYDQVMMTDSHRFGNVAQYLHPASGDQITLSKRFQLGRQRVRHTADPTDWTDRWTHVNGRTGETTSGHTLHSLYQHLTGSR